MNKFLSCPRKFQKDKLFQERRLDEHTQHTVFGKAFGSAVAEYLLTQSKEKALMRAYLDYYPVLEDEKKNQATLFSLIDRSFFTLDTLLEEWELAYFDDKPAIELGFRLNGLSDEHDIYFVGFLDLVLKNKITGQFAAVDVKTTSINSIDLGPLYKNSEQVLGYSIILDKIASKTDYHTMYIVGQFADWRNPFESKLRVEYYNKNLRDRLHWLTSLALDVKQIETMLDLNVFPRRGSACYEYRKPCPFYGTCTLETFDKYEDEPDDTNEYAFTFNINDLVTDYLERIQ